MNDIDFSIIRNLRKKWGLTAEELAAKASITRATVAKVEAGNGNPTIETIRALGRVFHLSAGELIRMAEVSHCEVGETRPFSDNGLDGSQIRFPNFEIFHLKAAAGVRKVSESRYHDNTAEVCLVISGRVRLVVGAETVNLGPGDAVRFKALQEHRIEIEQDAEFLLMHHNLPQH